jgi:hypothetical protein
MEISSDLKIAVMFKYNACISPWQIFTITIKSHTKTSCSWLNLIKKWIASSHGRIHDRPNITLTSIKAYYLGFYMWIKCHYHQKGTIFPWLFLKVRTFKSIHPHILQNFPLIYTSSTSFGNYRQHLRFMLK